MKASPFFVGHGRLEVNVRRTARGADENTIMRDTGIWLDK